MLPARAAWNFKGLTHGLYAGSERNPQQTWLRVGLTFPLLAGVVVGAAYNGALIAVLSVPTVAPGIETLEQLAGQSQRRQDRTTERGSEREAFFTAADHLEADFRRLVLPPA